VNCRANPDAGEEIVADWNARGCEILIENEYFFLPGVTGN
jgi:hypothetical protein